MTILLTGGAIINQITNELSTKSRVTGDYQARFHERSAWPLI